MEEDKVGTILLGIRQRRSFRPADHGAPDCVELIRQMRENPERFALHLDHLPRREATDLTPEELVETSVTEWAPEP